MTIANDFLGRDPDTGERLHAPIATDWNGICRQMGIVTSRSLAVCERAIVLRRSTLGDYHAVAYAEAVIRFGVRRFDPRTGQMRRKFAGDPLGWHMVKPPWYRSRKNNEKEGN